MRILIINPNSSKEMTNVIQKTAQEFAGDEFEVICKSTPGAPSFIETYDDQINAGPGMIQLLRENENDFDAFIVAGHLGINMDVMQEITIKPVVGIGEASMKIASTLGNRFSVVSTHKHSIPNKAALVHKYFLQNYLASIKVPS